MANFDVVDFPVLSEELKEKISKNAAWVIGEDIVPSVLYQAQFADGAWNWDDESVYRIYVKDPSEAAASIPAPAAAEEEIPAEDAEPIEGEGEGDAPAEEEASEAESLPELRPGKFGYAELGKIAVLEITPSEVLAEKFAKCVNVIIDGKEYAGLDILSEPIEFNMTKDHRVVIDWLHGEISESFSVIVTR